MGLHLSIGTFLKMVLFLNKEDRDISLPEGGIGMESVLSARLFGLGRGQG